MRSVIYLDKPAAWMLITLCFGAPAVRAGAAICAGCPAHPVDLEAAASSAGLSLSTGTPDAATLQSAQVFILQTGPAALTTAQQDAVEAFVRRGGSLLVALDPRAGTAAFRLSAILPSTIWRVNGKLNDGTGPDGAIRAVEWDREMFPSGEPRGMELPFHIRIRPFDAVERGQGRYERFSRTVPYLKDRVEAGNTFWTRALINRDWRVRLRGSGVEQIPLLITGRYGAGRVALFAAPVDSITPSAVARPCWTAVLRWLAAPRQSPVPAAPVTIQ